MKKTWLNLVVGESSTYASLCGAAPRPSTPLRRVLGEAEEGEEKSEPKEPAEPAEEPKREPAEEPIEVTGDNPEEMHNKLAGTVETLMSQWESGAKIEVAVKLLSEPISNREFVELVLSLGEESAMELGALLDEVQQKSDDDEPQDAVLSRVDDFHRHKSDAQREAEDFRERHAEGDVHAINAAEQ